MFSSYNKRIKTEICHLNTRYALSSLKYGLEQVQKLFWPLRGRSDYFLLFYDKWTRLIKYPQTAHFAFEYIKICVNICLPFVFPI